MKQETAINRLEKVIKSLNNKERHIFAPKMNSIEYKIIMNAIESCDHKAHTCRVLGYGSHIHNDDRTLTVCMLLNNASIKYELGNDAPRGGACGRHIKLTHIQ